MPEETTEPNRPNWLPTEYNINAPLRDRLPIMAKISGGIELHVSDQRGTVEVIGSPKQFSRNGIGTMTLTAGKGCDDSQWSWEITVPAEDANETEPILWSVNPDQDIEAYEATKQRWFTGLDVRIYGVDVHQIKEVPKQ